MHDLVTDLIGEEPTPELRIVTGGLEACVHQPCLIELGISERVLQPPIELGTSETEYPTA